MPEFISLLDDNAGGRTDWISIATPEIRKENIKRLSKIYPRSLTARTAKERLIEDLCNHIDCSGSNRGIGRLLQKIMRSFVLKSKSVDAAIPLSMILSFLVCQRPGKIDNSLIDGNVIKNYEFIGDDLKNQIEERLPELVEIGSQREDDSPLTRELGELAELLRDETSKSELVKDCKKEKEGAANVAGSRLSPVEVVLRVAGFMGGLWIRILQGIGHYVDIPQEDEEQFSKVYDQSPAVGKIDAYINLKNLAARDSDVAAFFSRLVSIGERLGGGSMYTVYHITVREEIDGKEEIVDGVMKLRNPNAEDLLNDSAAIARTVVADLKKEEKKKSVLSNLEMAEGLIDMAADWMKLDMNDGRFNEIDERFRKLIDRFVTGNGIEIKVPEMIALKKAKTHNETTIISKPALLVERVAEGKTVNNLFHDKSISQELRYQIATAIAESFVFMLKHPYKEGEKETYIMLSDIHPGNAIADVQRYILQLIDRSFYQELSEADAKLLLLFAEEGGGSQRLKEVIKSVLALPENRAKGHSYKLLYAKFVYSYLGIFGIMRYLIQPSSINTADIGNALIRYFRKSGIEIPLRIEIGLKNISAIKKMLQNAGLSTDFVRSEKDIALSFENSGTDMRELINLLISS
jgi:hypothetical protein